MNLEIKKMEIDHLDQVLAIEKKSFSSPWSRESYLGELNANEFAHYFVCVENNKGSEQVLAYAGMWLILDEAHITTIAVDTARRGQRLGEFLLIGLFKYAFCLGIDKATLEVRPSNKSALSLYERLEFEALGRRKGYYSDNGEDAIVMWKDLGKLHESVKEKEG